VADLRGKDLEQIVGRRLANVYRQGAGRGQAAPTADATTNGAAETTPKETK
jgi:hypothetical protein